MRNLLLQCFGFFLGMSGLWAVDTSNLKPNGSHYENQSFGFSINIPKNWITISSDEMSNIEQKGKDLLPNTPKSEQKLKDSKANTIILLSIVRNDDADEGAGPTLVMTSENVSRFNRIISASDYLKSISNNIKRAAIKIVNLSSESKELVLGGQIFQYIDLTASVQNTEVFQRYLATRIGEYVLLITLTFSSTDEKSELNEVLSTMKYEEKKLLT